MPLVKEIHIDEGLLVLWELTEELDWLKAQMPSLQKDLTFQSLKSKKRQQEWLSVKMMLKHIGCSDLTVLYASNGQPQINHPRYQHISISHSNQLAGIFLHPNQQVGLDIESISRNYSGVKKKYLSPEEIELTNQNKNWDCLFWCAKEAVYKIAGIPGIHFATQISLVPEQNNQLTAELKTPNHRQLFRLSYFKHCGQFIVYVTTQNPQQKKITD